MQGVVGVRRDDDLDAALLAHPQVDLAEVEPFRVGVALHGDAVFGAGVEDLFHVVVEGIAHEQAPAGRMTDDLRSRDSRSQASMRSVIADAVELHVGVDGTDHDVELRQDFVGIVEMRRP